MTESYFQKLRSEQYLDSSNLNARATLHDLFSVNKRGLHRWEFDHLLRLANGRILELGSGPAYVWLKNQDRIPDHWNVVVSDISPGMLFEARERTKALSLNMHYAVIDGQFLPFPDRLFRIVTAHHMVYHIPNMRDAVKEIRRVLDRSGYLLAATNGEEHMKEVRELVHNLSDELIFGSRDACGSSSSSFMKENGQALLSEFFDDVQWIEYEDDLRITDPSKLEEYVLSFPGNATEVFASSHMRSRLRAAILSEMDEEGVFSVTKSTGMFLAKVDGA
ncbi:MAG: class I SAM-dependent methyltransferase [Anaerolineales bacterium]